MIVIGKNEGEEKLVREGGREGGREGVQLGGIKDYTSNRKD